jgi:hypothetical protein
VRQSPQNVDHHQNYLTNHHNSYYPVQNQGNPASYHGRNNMWSPTYPNFGLPPIQADSFGKQMKVIFHSMDDFDVFYNQVRNSACEWGIYLIDLHSVKHDKSLCPLEYNGCPITATRYNEIAAILYQYLARYDVISNDHTVVRNLINQLAEANDGYQVLYGMLTMVHPGLHKDRVVNPPKVNDYSDIHEYAKAFYTFLKFESFSGRPYTARDQVNQFINGLSHEYSPAIARVRQLLDTWQKYDPIGPDCLSPVSLPMTIERYMLEALGPASICMLRRKGNRGPAPNIDAKRNRNSSLRADHQSPAQQRRDGATDIICALCACYGHKTSECISMGKFIVLSENLKQLDPTIKVKLVEHLKQVQQQKQMSRKIHSKVDVIRQLYAQGKFNEAEESYNQEVLTEVDDESSDGISHNSNE